LTADGFVATTRSAKTAGREIKEDFMRREMCRWMGLGFFAVLSLAGCGGDRNPPPTMSLPAASETAASASATTGEVVPAAAPSLEAAKLLSSGELQAALTAAESGIRATPSSAQAYETRAQVLHKLGRSDESLADFAKAIELEPRNARLLNNRGFLLMSRREFDAAIADFDAAVAADAKYANAYNNRGLAQIAQGRYRQAIVDLDQALLADPNYVDAYNNRGFAMMQMGRWDRALADFNRALSLRAEEVNALANRGFVKQNLGDLEGAVMDYTAAMLIDPENPKYYLHRREAYLLQGLAEQAQQDAEKVVALQEVLSLTARISSHPQEVDGYLLRGAYYRKQGDDTRAMADFTKGVELDSTHIPARIKRAELLVKRRDFTAAEADCEAVLKQQPDQQAHSLRGDSRLSRGDIDGAIADFEAAKRIDDRVAEAYLLKSRELTKQGDSGEAARYHELAKNLDPGVEDRVR
jgi:tetratricopeptide (TPR) repeat protein